MLVNSIKNIGARCLGCGACVNACSQNAITMKYDAEGFLYPVIDGSQCTECRRCLKSCPVYGDAFALKTNMPKCFAAYSNDDVALQSSSGGIFTVLAEHTLSAGGFVCGAAFDANWLVAHTIVSDKNDLGRLRTSKYIQSDTNSVYREIRQLLDNGKAVLFSGTPCQVAGLHGFLGGDCDNLLTMDLFCHGVPSPKIWEKYIREISNYGEIQSVNFRDKSITASGEGNGAVPFSGWKEFRLTIKRKNASLFSEHNGDNIFMRGFDQNLYLRKSCAKCPFAKTPRTADISIGDFWGYDRLDSKRDTSRGISAILANTEKGVKVFAEIRDGLRFMRKVSLKDITQGNPVLEKPCKAHERRMAFFSDFTNLKENEQVSDLIAQHLGDKDVGIMNFSGFESDNFGAVLVGYAMEKAIAKLGYNASTIRFVPQNLLYRSTNGNTFHDFRKRFMNISGICTNKEDLGRYINKKYARIIVGSDQIIRCHFDFIYYLDWVSGKKSLLSYAASFGIPVLGMTNSDKKYAAKCLERFDAYSMREESGAKLMKDEFGKEYPVVCDPTMLLSADEYMEILHEGDELQLPAEYVAYYFLDEKAKYMRELERKYPIIDAYRDDAGNYRSVGDWLNIIRNAKYVVTNSFHGSVFSILYRKEFVAIPWDFPRNDRIQNLMESFGIDRLIVDKETISENLFSRRIDYDRVQESLEKMRAQGHKWLQAAMAIAPNEKTPLSRQGTYVKLLNVFPIMKIIRKGQKIRFRLFGIIPILKIKNDAIYLFEFLKIAKIGGKEREWRTNRLFH